MNEMGFFAVWCKTIIDVELEKVFVTQFAPVHKSETWKQKPQTSTERLKWKQITISSENLKRFSSFVLLFSAAYFVGWWRSNIRFPQRQKPCKAASVSSEKIAKKTDSRTKSDINWKIDVSGWLPGIIAMCSRLFVFTHPEKKKKYKNSIDELFSHKLEFGSRQITICRSPKKIMWKTRQFYMAFPQTAHDGYTKIRFIIYCNRVDVFPFFSRDISVIYFLFLGRRVGRIRGLGNKKYQPYFLIF